MCTLTATDASFRVDEDDIEKFLYTAKLSKFLSDNGFVHDETSTTYRVLSNDSTVLPATREEYLDFTRTLERSSRETMLNVRMTEFPHEVSPHDPQLLSAVEERLTLTGGDDKRLQEAYRAIRPSSASHDDVPEFIKTILSLQDAGIPTDVVKYLSTGPKFKQSSTLLKNVITEYDRISEGRYDLLIEFVNAHTASKDEFPYEDRDDAAESIKQLALVKNIGLPDDLSIALVRTHLDQENPIDADDVRESWEAFKDGFVDDDGTYPLDIAEAMLGIDSKFRM